MVGNVGVGVGGDEAGAGFVGGEADGAVAGGVKDDVALVSGDVDGDAFDAEFVKEVYLAAGRIGEDGDEGGVVGTDEVEAAEVGVVADTEGEAGLVGLGVYEGEAGSDAAVVAEGDEVAGVGVEDGHLASSGCGDE